MKTTALILTIAALSISPCAYSQDAPAEKPVFRAPFTLNLKVDDTHYWQEKVEPVPYVAEGDIYLFIGESFGINVKVVDDKVLQIVYQPDLSKADVQFKFTQEQSKDSLMSLLIIQNNTKHVLYFDAVMTKPDDKNFYNTSIVPVPAGLKDFESWPHPIVQLALRNLRFTDDKAHT